MPVQVRLWAPIEEKMISDTKDTLTISDSLYYFWKNKNTFLISLGIFSLAGIIYSLSLPNVYESEAIFVDGRANSGGIADGSALSSLGTLAGIDMPTTKGTSSINEGLERMKSIDFLTQFIKKYDYLNDIVLSIDWDPSSRKLIYDDELYDKSTKTWDPALLSWEEEEPFEVARKKLVEELEVNFNFRDRVYTISYRHFSPYFAQELLSNLIKEIDSVQRDLDIKDLKAKEAYLTSRISSTLDANVSKSLGFLIQSNLREQTIAFTSDYYYFKVVAWPTIPFKKAAPIRAVICILFFIIGFLFTLIFISIKNFFINRIFN